MGQPAPNDDASKTRDFWIDRAGTTNAEVAVYTHTRSQRYDVWSRRMLQTWTLSRLRELGPRYRRCVDLGCGYGDWTEQLATISDEVFACDVAPSFVEQTRMRVPWAIVTCADVRAYDIPRGIDMAYLGAVLMHLDDADVLTLLKRVRSRAARHAVIVVRDWCTYNLGRRTERPDPRYYSIHRRPRDLRELAIATGFQCVELQASPAIYADVLAARRPWLRWPMRALWRLATLHWQRASTTMILAVD